MGVSILRRYRTVLLFYNSYFTFCKHRFKIRKICGSFNGNTNIPRGIYESARPKSRNLQSVVSKYYLRSYLYPVLVCVGRCQEHAYYKQMSLSIFDSALEITNYWPIDEKFCLVFNVCSIFNLTRYYFLSFTCVCLNSWQ